jgi:hypothetical protein
MTVRSDDDYGSDAYTDMLGIDPGLIVPRAKVEKIRRAYAQLRQAKRLERQHRAISRLRFLASGQIVRQKLSGRGVL